MFAVKRLFVLVTASLILMAGSAAFAQTPQYDLLKAVDREDAAKVSELLQQGVSANTRRRSDRIPAIVMAAQSGNMTIMKLLLDHEANPDLADSNRGETALMIRATAGDTNMVQLLLSYNADPNRADIGQETALMKAVRGRKFKAAKALIEAGADPNVQDLTGKTALEYAQLSRSRRFIRLLQDAGATY